MKKRILAFAIAALSAVMLLSGCGGASYKSEEGTSYIDSTYYGGEVESVLADQFLSIEGNLVDYSYDIVAYGNIKDKKIATGILDVVKDFVAENDGYIENLSDTYNKYDNIYNSRYSTSYDYKAYGTISFTVQVLNEDAADLVALLENYCDSNGLNITRFNQYALNYEGYEIVSEYSDEYYYNNEITIKDLEKRLSYTDIDVTVNYGTKRSFIAKMWFNISSAVSGFFEEFDGVIYAILAILVIGFTSIFVIICGHGMIKKSIYKKKKKHPEWYEAKHLVIDYANNDIIGAKSNADTDKSTEK